MFLSFENTNSTIEIVFSPLYSTLCTIQRSNVEPEKGKNQNYVCIYPSDAQNLRYMI
jgi:hypothetical protein